MILMSVVAASCSRLQHTGLNLIYCHFICKWNVFPSSSSSSSSSAIAAAASSLPLLFTQRLTRSSLGRHLNSRHAWFRTINYLFFLSSSEKHTHTHTLTGVQLDILLTFIHKYTWCLNCVSRRERPSIWINVLNFSLVSWVATNAIDIISNFYGNSVSCYDDVFNSIAVNSIQFRECVWKGERDKNPNNDLLAFKNVLFDHHQKLVNSIKHRNLLLSPIRSRGYCSIAHASSVRISFFLNSNTAASCTIVWRVRCGIKCVKTHSSYVSLYLDFCSALSVEC